MEDDGKGNQQRPRVLPVTQIFLKDFGLLQNDPGKLFCSHSVYTLTKAARRACPWVCGQGRRGQAQGGFGAGYEVQVAWAKCCVSVS